MPKGDFCVLFMVLVVLMLTTVGLNRSARSAKENVAAAAGIDDEAKAASVIIFKFGGKLFNKDAEAKFMAMTIKTIKNIFIFLQVLCIFNLPKYIVSAAECTLPYPLTPAGFYDYKNGSKLYLKRIIAFFAADYITVFLTECHKKYNHFLGTGFALPG